MSTNTLNLVGQIYDAVSEPERWDSFLDSFAKEVGSQAAQMRMVDKSNDRYTALLPGLAITTHLTKAIRNTLRKLTYGIPSLPNRNLT